MYSQNTNPVAVLSNRKTEIYIVDLPARLGRNNNTVDIYFFHESVSREHCLFEYINGRITVRDLGSTVGTCLNGVKLEPDVPYNIDDGMKITIGKVKFVFHENRNELAAREAAQARSRAASSQYYGGRAAEQRADWYKEDSSTGGSKDKGTGGPVTVSAKELNEYEYDESEVIFVECGLTPDSKPLSYTSDLVRGELDDALKAEDAKKDAPAGNAAKAAAAAEEIREADNEMPEKDDPAAGEAKKTQAISTDDLIAARNEAEDRAADEMASKAEVITPAETGADNKGEKVKEEKAGAEEKTETKPTVVLRWIDDETGEKKLVKLDHFPFRIGRKSDENDYAVRRKGVSRRHIYFEESEGRVWLIDDNSTNGTALNAEKIKKGERTEIRSGDSIRIADIVFAVTIE